MSENSSEGPKKRTLTAEKLGLVNNARQRIPSVRADQLEIEGTARLKYRVLSDRQVTLTHELAARYIDLPVFEGERLVVETHVQRLYDEMRNGNFNWMLVILATAVLRGVEHKLNGQHCTWALSFMPESYRPTVREIKFEVDSVEQLKLLYGTFDRLFVRTDSHVASVHLAGTAAMDGVWKGLLPKLFAGLKLHYFATGAERNRVTPKQLAVIVENEMLDVWKKVAGIVQTHFKSHKHIVRGPVMAAMFATFEKAPQKALEFWNPVADGVGLTVKGDPRLKLRDMLMRTALQTNRGEKESVSAETMYRDCLQAWNHWRDGKSIQILRTPSERPRVK